MLAGPLYSAVARPLSVAAELIPREQAGEFRLLTGTEPDCVQPYHPTECSLLLQTAKGSPPRHMMGHVFMTHDVTGLAGFRGNSPWTGFRPADGQAGGTDGMTVGR